jgi:hypothetical protein
MRFLRTGGEALSAAWTAFDLRQLVRWARVGLVVTGTTVAVVLASFVAVALGLT